MSPYPFQRKVWFWVLLIDLGLVLVCLFPGPRRWIHPYDIAVARGCNALLGRNATFDQAIALLNSKAGDAMILLGVMTLLAWHVVRGRGIEERLQRSAFWIWVILLFVLFYRVQSGMEGLLHRESPAVELHRWRNLNRMYDIPTRVYHLYSFPSGHATAYFFFACMAWRRYPAMFLKFLALGLILPSTRIVTGAHWATDIFLGSVPLVLLLVALIRETPLARTEQFAARLARWAFEALRRRMGRPGRTPTG